MKHCNLIIALLIGILPVLCTSGCVEQETKKSAELPSAEKIAAEEKAKAEQQAAEKATLPVRYQQPFYTLDTESTQGKVAEEEEQYKIKVGANITSTKGPQPLWDILKKLAALQNMSVSWASDVDQNVLVDVNIRATDNFFDAIDNLLRQVDYFHEVQGTTIIVHYKETKQYHVAIPFTKQKYETGTGGNVLGGDENASQVEGTIRLESKENEFDLWKNIQENLDIIISTWSTTAVAPQTGTTTTETAGTNTSKDESKTAAKDETTANNESGQEVAPAPVQATRQISKGDNSYTIDKPVGIITVHAPRPLQSKIKAYLDNIDKELFRQIMIEAKIIEVQLNDSSSLGIDWNLLLRGLSMSGGMSFATNYGKTNTDTDNTSNSRDSTSTTTYNKTVNHSSSLTQDQTIDNITGTTSADSNTNQFISGSDSTWSLDNTLTNASSVASTAATVITGGASNAAAATISLASLNFADFLNALSEQGNASILSNPKLSVMNGQPALITVGKNQTYISKITSEVDSDTGIVTYTVETDRVLSGVGLALSGVIRGEDEIIMTLVPVTSQLQGEIEYRTVGEGQVGLPIINIREMNTMVKVKDGEMLVVGGLIDNYETTDGSFVPGVGNIPGLRYLFGVEKKVLLKRELIILLRPQIM